MRVKILLLYETLLDKPQKTSARCFDGSAVDKAVVNECHVTTESAEDITAEQFTFFPVEHTGTVGWTFYVAHQEHYRAIERLIAIAFDSWRKHWNGPLIADDDGLADLSTTWKWISSSNNLGDRMCLRQNEQCLLACVRGYFGSMTLHRATFNRGDNINRSDN